MTDLDDTDLWRRSRRDDPDAFGQLFERHGERIHRYVLRLTGDPSGAEDVVAVAFLEVWRRRGSVELHNGSLLPWLYAVTGNVVRQWRRTQRRHQALLDRLAELPPRHPDLVERQAEASEEAARVLGQVRGLPRWERDVLVLSVWEGLSHAEIAVVLGTTTGTVKSRLSRARARLGRDRSFGPVTAPALDLKES